MRETGSSHYPPVALVSDAISCKGGQGVEHGNAAERGHLLARLMISFDEAPDPFCHESTGSSSSAALSGSGLFSLGVRSSVGVSRPASLPDDTVKTDVFPGQEDHLEPVATTSGRESDRQELKGVRMTVCFSR